MSRRNIINRRKFLKASALALVGAGLTAAKNLSCVSKREEGEEKPLRVEGFRLLGRTGFRVSEIGCGNIQDEGLLSAMLDAGVNYIDTAESYPGHHRIVGRAISGRERKSIFITSKMQMEGDTSVKGLVSRVHRALEELNTDYIDCMMMHMPEKAETLGHKDFHQAMERLKSEGRVRFIGVSHHGSFWLRAPEETMEKVLLTAADGRFDVFLLAYNFLQMVQGKRVLDVCRQKKIGTALMKTTPVYRYYLLKSRIEKLEEQGKEIHPLFREGLKRFKEKADRAEDFIKKNKLEDPEEIREAAIQFVLSNPNVNTVCCSIRTYEEMKRIVRLSRKKLGERAKARLEAYRRGCGELYCRHACGLCEPSCPHGVPVNTIARYFHYYLGQGREREAMLRYGEISGSRADKCKTCPGYCESSCPYRVPAQGMLLLAHDQLSIG